MPKRKQIQPEVEVTESYDSKQYWDKRYENSNQHEWYYSFELLSPLIEKSLTNNFSGTVLEIGCGDRPLVEDFVAKFPTTTSLTAIDYSQTVIDLLSSKSTNTKIRYQQMDARRTNFLSSHFDFIVDKGTIDAMLSADSEEVGFRNVSRIISEAVRVMKDNATFMIVSHIEAESCEFDELMQQAVLPALETKYNVLWSIEAHSVKTNKEEGGYGTVYMISSRTRKLTRSGHLFGAPVSFKVLEYDSEDEEN